MRYPVLLSLLLVGCGASQADTVRCQLDALKVLPDDPLQVTPYDAIDLVQRIHACKHPATPSPLLVTDAGF